ncbi:MAG: DUF4286 family protein [Brumimicrobium sp.]|nr:DUF4286 family protein [Brumimicrobium sp.]MCO5267294.1 DUF4286 family protein [Brumimicrobium sp.]
MVVYNVTVSIDKDIAETWLQWMKEVHIPDVMLTNHFRDCKLCRVHGEEEGGYTFAIMYTAKSQEDLDMYQNLHASRLQREHTQKFQGKFAAFRTLLTVVQEF